MKLVDAGNVVAAGDMVAAEGVRGSDGIRDWGRFLTTYSNIGYFDQPASRVGIRLVNHKPDRTHVNPPMIGWRNSPT